MYAKKHKYKPEKHKYNPEKHKYKPENKGMDKDIVRSVNPRCQDKTNTV
jgi:hypothetical protein